MSAVFLIPSDIKNKILNTYAKETSNQGETELEARFGSFKNKRFTPGITRQIYNRVKAYFDERVKPQESKITDYIMGKVRKSVLPDSSVIWITKERLWNEENFDYGLRFSMSRELPVPPVDDKIFKPDTIREKNRFSYLVFGNAVRIDLTLVNMILGTNREKTKDTIAYELEIELLDKTKIAQFEKALAVTLSIVLDTIVLYTEREKQEVINDVNAILGSAKRGALDNYPLVQARNLKLRDMVYGGLIGNNRTGYNVTFKADGLRKMLYFARSGVYLLSPPQSIMRISDKEILGLTGTILDGELIPLDKRLKVNNQITVTARLWFLAFDALAWNNDKSIQNGAHYQRMLYCQTVADKCKGDLLLVNTKNFRSFETPQEFFQVMREMFTERLLLPYKQDGFMFTPQNTEYNPHSDSLPLKRRILTEVPDICKWKPKEELTIDFQIKWRIPNNTNGKRKLELYVNEKGQPIPFPEDYVVDSEADMTKDLPSNTVVEYAFDYQRKMLIPIRVRHDKILPNKIDVARDIWLDIRDPIEADTLKGNNFVLLRKYHNSIKRKLINMAIDGKERMTLLDIGSGYGGDLNKWRAFNKIIAVEPDPEHVEELNRRIVTYGMQDKVKVVIAGGQETDKIRRAVEDYLGKDKKVDVVSTMLSLTFFWKSSDLVQALVDTILTNLKPNGKFIFLTMDGDLVQQTFEPAFGTGLVLNKLELGPATIEYNSQKSMIDIHIEGTIVENQTEWLVRLKDLVILLGQFNYKMTLQHKADEEKFLTEEEIIMTQMYTYGMFNASNNIPNENKIENIVSDNTYLPSENITDILSLPEIQPEIRTEIRTETKPEIRTEIKPEIKPEIRIRRKEPLDMDRVKLLRIDWWQENMVRIGSIKEVSMENNFLNAVLNGFLFIYQNNPDIEFRENLVNDLEMELPSSDYNEIADKIGIGIYIITEDGVLFSTHTDLRSVILINIRTKEEPYYETVGVEREGIYQTYFDPQDPFIAQLNLLIQE